MVFPPQGSAGAIPSNTVVTEQTLGQASTAGVAGTSSRGDHTHGTPTVALDDLSDVTIAAPIVDEILRYNGVGWANGAAAVVGAGTGVIFFLDSTKVIPAGIGPQTKSLETLLRSPSSAAEVDESQTVNSNTAIIDQYMHNTALGVISIDGGEWEFDTYTYVDDATDTSEVIVSTGRVFVGAGTITITGLGTTRTATVTGGTPFLLSDFNADITQTASIITPNAVLVVSGFTSTSVVTVTCLATYTNEAGVAYSVDRFMFQVTTGDINALAPTLMSVLTVQPAFPANLTDKLMVKYFARTNHVGNVNVHLLHNGTEHYTHFHTPLQTKHNDLAGLQGGAANQFYHLTATEYTGTGTGIFVRTNAPTIATPSMTNVAITSGSITGTDVTATDLKSATTTIAIDAAAEPVAGQVLTATSNTTANWQTVIGGVVSDILRNTKGGTDALRDNLVGTDNSAFGYNALLLDTASFNTAFGSRALDANTSGTQNTAVGYQAGSAIVTTNDCTFIGFNTGLLTTGANNTFIGSTCGDANTSGARNTAVGKDALGANTTSSDCTMIGYQAGLLSTGTSNTFIGSLAGDANTSGTRNTAVGYNALSANITSNDCTAIGSQAGPVNTGTSNTFIGSFAGQFNNVGHNNVFVGDSAGAGNLGASDNTFIGSTCGDANTSGARNTAVGKDALGANITSSDCTMIGYQAGILSTGTQNTFIGSSAGDANTTGLRNTAVGYNALGANTTSGENTAIGWNAGLVSTGSDNTFLGANSGLATTISSFNTILGYASGYTNTTGANNVFIGALAIGSAITRSDAIAIGYNASVSADKTWVIGTIGIKQAIVEGTNAAMGVATLIAGTVTVPNTLVTANSRIFLTSQDPNGGIQGAVFVSARTVGTDFTITSTIGVADISIVAWEIKEPN